MPNPFFGSGAQRLPRFRQALIMTFISTSIDNDIDRQCAEALQAEEQAQANVQTRGKWVRSDDGSWGYVGDGSGSWSSGWRHDSDWHWKSGRSEDKGCWRRDSGWQWSKNNWKSRSWEDRGRSPSDGERAIANTSATEKYIDVIIEEETTALTKEVWRTPNWETNFTPASERGWLPWDSVPSPLYQGTGMPFRNKRGGFVRPWQGYYEFEWIRAKMDLESPDCSERVREGWRRWMEHTDWWRFQKEEAADREAVYHRARVEVSMSPSRSPSDIGSGGPAESSPQTTVVTPHTARSTHPACGSGEFTPSTVDEDSHWEVVQPFVPE